MTTEELLKPRIKVIAPMPLMVNEVGYYLERIETKEGFKFGIMTKEKMVLYPKGVFKEWPHIFREVSWWEDRNPEDMPEYVKWQDGFGTENRIVKFEMLQENTINIDGNPMTASLWLEHLTPATKEEYEQYLKTKQP